MEPITNLILSLLGLIGLSGIITARMNKVKEIEFQKLEQKQHRYRSVLLYMNAFFNLENLKFFSNHQPILNSAEDVLRHVKAEYHEMLLYASKDVIMSLKHFIQNPIRQNFLYVVLAMRKDLWINKADLDVSMIMLDES